MNAAGGSGETLAGLPVEAWVSAGAGLVGAVIGGMAALLGSWFEGRNARTLARDLRIEEAVSAVLADLWALMVTDAPDGQKPTSDFVKDLSMMQRVSWAQALTVKAEPQLSALLLAYGNAFDMSAPIGETRVVAAGASAALTHWQSDPGSFKKQKETLADYVTEAARQLGAVPPSGEP